MKTWFLAKLELNCTLSGSNHAKFRKANTFIAELTKAEPVFFFFLNGPH